MNNRTYESDILIIGAGPAGLAAVDAAAKKNFSLTVVDDNPAVGGQIWRGENRRQAASEVAEWFDKFQAANVEFIGGAKVVARPQANLLIAETFDGLCEIRFQKLILATGARERFLPFPGWTLPNVAGAGGLQALVKSGMPIAGKRVVVSGSGALLLAVAAYLKKHDAKVLLIAEQAPLKRLVKFALGLLGEPEKLMQAIALKKVLLGTRYLTDCYVTKAHGEDRLTGVTLKKGERIWDVECDYLACGFHLLPNTELALLLGCATENGSVKVDEYQQTSVEHIYCAGESTGIGGLELSLIEGQIAGFAATGQTDKARNLFNARAKAQGFADLLNDTFALREELKTLAESTTIVCRCEDVTFERLQQQSGWREAKLHTRCGMGACQGRICGGATDFLFDWNVESIRPPAFPCRVESLLSFTQTIEK
jgi:NADPH-dependent 2,4-dienoyl-CoA reductase/sulfur reductase-like enzyme